MSLLFLNWLFPFGLGAVTGVLSGFGVGGGTLLLVILTAGMGMDQHMAQGINLLYFLPAAAMALPKHWRNSYIEKGALLPAIAAGLGCAAAAAWISTSLDIKILRRIFGGFLILVGVHQAKHRKSLL